MSNAQTGLQASDAEPAFSEAVADGGSDLTTAVAGEPCSDFTMNDGSDLGGHTLLSRAAVPQGRRSLFRR